MFCIGIFVSRSNNENRQNDLYLEIVVYNCDVNYTNGR